MKDGVQSTATFGMARISSIELHDIKKDKKVLAESVAISSPDDVTSVALDGTLQLTATINPENTNNKVVTWTSSNANVATVDENGLVTAVAQGYVTITATVDGKTDSITLDIGDFATLLSQKKTAVENNDGTGVLPANQGTFATIKEKALDDLAQATTGADATKIVADFEAEVEKLKSVVYNVTLHYGSLNYTENAGEIDTTLTVSQGQTLEQPTGSGYAQTMPGYKLVGWYSDKTLETPYVFGSEVTEAIELWAKHDKVKVTFDANGGAFEDGATTLQGTIIESTNDDNGTVTKPADPTQEGYTFKGWNKGDATFDFTTQLFEDTNLVAQWEKKATLVDTEHNLDITELSKVLASGKSTTSALDIGEFKFIDGKLSHKAASGDVAAYISLNISKSGANDGTITFTTQSDNAKFIVNFQSSTSGRKIVFTGPNGDDGQPYTNEIDYANKNTDKEITLGKAGTYTMKISGGEIKMNYMKFIDKRPEVIENA